MALAFKKRDDLDKVLKGRSTSHKSDFLSPDKIEDVDKKIKSQKIF